MNRFIAVSIFVMSLTFCGQVRRENGRQVILPNSKLIGCSSPGCSQLWLINPPDANAIYPKQVSIDLRDSCPTGIVARYDKSVSIQEIKAAIDQRYGKWALAENDDTSVLVKLWRVEPEKFAIQLAVVDKDMEAMTLGQTLSQGPRQREKVKASEVIAQVIYLAFSGSNCGH